VVDGGVGWCLVIKLSLRSYIYRHNKFYFSLLPVKVFFCIGMSGSKGRRAMTMCERLGGYERFETNNFVGANKKVFRKFHHI
jgi:hypothetical protein